MNEKRGRLPALRGGLVIVSLPTQNHGQRDSSKTGVSTTQRERERERSQTPRSLKKLQIS